MNNSGTQTGVRGANVSSTWVQEISPEYKDEPLFAYALKKATQKKTNTIMPSRRVQNPLEVECQRAEKRSEKTQENKEKFEKACELYEEYVTHPFRYKDSSLASYHRGYWLNDVEKNFNLGRIKGGDTKARANRRIAYLKSLINTLADRHQFSIPEGLKEYFR